MANHFQLVEYMAPISVAAYSYMSLVPVIMPPIMRLMTTKKERQIRMPYSQRTISRTTRILFPIVVTIIVGTLVPFGEPAALEAAIREALHHDWDRDFILAYARANTWDRRIDQLVGEFQKVVAEYRQGKAPSS